MRDRLRVAGCELVHSLGWQSNAGAVPGAHCFLHLLAGARPLYCTPPQPGWLGAACLC